MSHKFCNKCKKNLPLESFNRMSSSTDGRQHQCKQCRAEIQRAYRATDKGKERDRRYNKTESKKLASYRYWAKQPFAYEAQYKTKNAIRDGVLSRPPECEKCKSKGRVEAHHCDYTKPLDVMWLCTSCHKDWHTKNTPIYK